MPVLRKQDIVQAKENNNENKGKMKCSAIIRINWDAGIIRGFKPEDKKIGERAKYSIRKKGKEIIFSIKAEDAAALRASFNSVTKTLAVAEKIKEVE